MIALIEREAASIASHLSNKTSWLDSVLLPERKYTIRFFFRRATGGTRYTANRKRGRVCLLPISVTLPHNVT